jgi:hypothetical protein
MPILNETEANILQAQINPKELVRKDEYDNTLNIVFSEQSKFGSMIFGCCSDSYEAIDSVNSKFKGKLIVFEDDPNSRYFLNDDVKKVYLRRGLHDCVSQDGLKCMYEMSRLCALHIDKMKKDRRVFSRWIPLDIEIQDINRVLNVRTKKYRVMSMLFDRLQIELLDDEKVGSMIQKVLHARYVNLRKSEGINTHVLLLALASLALVNKNREDDGTMFFSLLLETVKWISENTCSDCLIKQMMLMVGPFEFDYSNSSYRSLVRFDLDLTLEVLETDSCDSSPEECASDPSFFGYFGVHSVLKFKHDDAWMFFQDPSGRPFNFKVSSSEAALLYKGIDWFWKMTHVFFRNGSYAGINAWMKAHGMNSYMDKKYKELIAGLFKLATVYPQISNGCNLIAAQMVAGGLFPSVLQRVRSLDKINDIGVLAMILFDDTLSSQVIENCILLREVFLCKNVTYSQYVNRNEYEGEIYIIEGARRSRQSSFSSGFEQYANNPSNQFKDQEKQSDDLDKNMQQEMSQMSLSIDQAESQSVVRSPVVTRCGTSFEYGLSQPQLTTVQAPYPPRLPIGTLALPTFADSVHLPLINIAPGTILYPRYRESVHILYQTDLHGNRTVGSNGEYVSRPVYGDKEFIGFFPEGVLPVDDPHLDSSYFRYS